MTHEPPARAGRPASGAAARLAALLAEFDQAEGAPPTAEPVGAPGPEDPPTNGATLAALRARIAEMAPFEAGGLEGGYGSATTRTATPARAAPPAPTPPRPQIRPEAPTIPPPPRTPAPEAKPDVTGDVPPPKAPPASTDEGGSGWRARVLPIAMVLLIIAIPVLGFVGARTILDSRAGKVKGRSLDPNAPGYVAIVEPTPTALMVQKDATGAPVSLTVLALGTGDAGGSVLFVPLDTNLVTPALYVDRLRTAFVRGGESTLVAVTANLLNISFDKSVDVSDADWAQLVGPVTPLKFDNPVALTSGATTWPAGPIELPADQVGAYLAATAPDQDDLDRMDRQQLLWRTWMSAISSVGAAGVPKTTNGLGPFIEALSSGKTSMATLPVVPAAAQSPDGTPAFDPQVDQIVDQVTDAVPAPTSPSLDARFSMRVLSGVRGEPVPDKLIQALVKGGAQIDALGNAPSFGAKGSTIEYRSGRFKEKAEHVRSILHGGRIRFDPETNDPVDLVVVVGRDVLKKFSG